MKTSKSTLQSVAVALAAMLSLSISSTASAQALNLTFDMSQYSSPTENLNASDIYLTFQATTATINYVDSSGSTENLDFANSLTTNTTGTFATTQSIPLSTILGDKSGGINIESATNLDIYISYGGTTGLSQLAAGLQPNANLSTTSRYGQVELNTGIGSAIDLTNINQFGASLQVATLSSSGTEGYVGNTVNTAQVMHDLVNVAGGNSSVAVQANANPNTSAPDQNQQYTRVVGPSTFTSGNPYPSMSSYITQLYNSPANSGSSGVATIANLRTGASAGGEGSIGMTSIANDSAHGIDSGKAYLADYNFTAKINADGGVILTGSVSMAYNNGTATTVVGTYNNLTITVSGSDMKQFLYGESTTALKILATGTDATAFQNAFGGTAQGANAGIGLGLLTQEVGGDFAQGMLIGAVGNSATGSYIDANGVAHSVVISSMASAEWFTSGSNAYNSTTNGNPYSQIISKYSQGYTSAGGTFNGFAAYANPYDDRFGTVGPGALLVDGSTTGVQITLMPDGNLEAVPEPSTNLLMELGGAMLVGGLFWRRKQTRRAI